MIRKTQRRLLLAPLPPSSPSSSALYSTFPSSSIYSNTSSQKACFLYLLPFGILMETIGYWSRTYSIRHLTSTLPYNILLLQHSPSKSPQRYNTRYGGSFTTPARPHTAPSVLFMPTPFITPFFVAFDMIIFLHPSHWPGDYGSAVAEGWCDEGDSEERGKRHGSTKK